MFPLRRLVLPILTFSCVLLQFTVTLCPAGAVRQEMAAMFMDHAWGASGGLTTVEYALMLFFFAVTCIFGFPSLAKSDDSHEHEIASTVARRR